MKNKGFTLIELLSVIIVLAILALVSVPIMTRVLTNVEKESTRESAIGYVTALNQTIVDSNYSTKKKINNGYYYVSYLTTEYDFEVSGSTPVEDSWVYIKDGEVNKYSLKYDKYVATKLDDEIELTDTVATHDTCFKAGSKKEVCYEDGEIVVKEK